MESLTYLFTLPLDPLPSREEKRVMGQTVQSFFFDLKVTSKNRGRYSRASFAVLLKSTELAIYVMIS
jgi:hypothetical protein